MSSPHYPKSVVSRAQQRMKEPGAAEINVDGDSEDSGSWDEPATAWMEAKKAAVRRVMACTTNDMTSLPPIGARVERIVLQKEGGYIYFEDGTFVEFSVEALQEPSCSHSVLAASDRINMVAAVRNGVLLGAMDTHRRGAMDVRFWAVKVGTPFDLVQLSEVPLHEARVLTDFGSRMTRTQDGKQAWALARKYADPRPFKRVR